MTRARMTAAATALAALLLTGCAGSSEDIAVEKCRELATDQVGAAGQVIEVSEDGATFTILGEASGTTYRCTVEVTNMGVGHSTKAHIQSPA